MPDADQITWTYPTAEELQGKTIRIENTKLDPIFATLIIDAKTGEGIGNITRVQLYVDIDIAAAMSHITAVVTLYSKGSDKQVILDNPELLIDAVVSDVEQDARSNELFDANAFFAKFDEVVYLQDMKRWITEELASPLEEVAGIGIDIPPLFTGVTEQGFKAFKPGRIMLVAVKFTNGDVRYKTINLDNYGSQSQGISEQVE